MTAIVLSSPRTRRRLVWLGAVAALAGAVIVLSFALPSRSPAIEDTPVVDKPAVVMNEPKTVPAPRAELNALLDAFIPAVLARKDLAAGWNLVVPSERGSKAEWMRGETPFQAYAAKPGTYHGWRLNYSYPGDVGFDLYVSPVKKSLVAMAFRGEAVKVGGEWRIKVFYPQATFQPSGKRQLVYTEQDMKPGIVGQPGTARLPSWYLLVPLAFVGSIAALGILFGLFRMLRRRSRVREIERELAAQRVAEGRA